MLTRPRGDAGRILSTHIPVRHPDVRPARVQNGSPAALSASHRLKCATRLHHTHENPVMIDNTLRLPAEWEPQAAVLIAWPHAGTDWAERLASVETTYAALAAAVTRFQPLIVVLADSALQQH